jgi:hypothetical protein
MIPQGGAAGSADDRRPASLFAGGIAPLPMRAHHLLCTLGFAGLGYSRAFAANMAAIIATLDRHPETVIAVVDTPDGICAAFPPELPTHCRDTSVISRDRAVLGAMGLQAGSTPTWGQARQAVARAFAPDDLQQLCASCPWLPLGHCAAGLGRFRHQIDRT